VFLKPVHVDCYAVFEVCNSYNSTEVCIENDGGCFIA